MQRTHLGQCRHHLHLGDEFDLVERVAAGRIFKRHNHASVAHHQRQYLQTLGRSKGQLAYRIDLDREVFDVDQRIAHLACQGRLQGLARHDALAYQQFAQRNGAIVALLLKRFVKLLGRYQPHGDERLADAHHGHLGLLLDGHQQLLGRHHLAAHQDVAHAARAQILLFPRDLFDLFRCRGAFKYQQVANALAHLDIGEHFARNENAAHRIVRIAHRFEQVEAVSVLPVSHGDAFELAAGLERNPVIKPWPTIQLHVADQTGTQPWPRTQGLYQFHALELGKLQTQRRTGRWHIDLRLAFLGLHQDHPP